jgi:hypothetical protein
MSPRLTARPNRYRSRPAIWHAARLPWLRQALRGDRGSVSVELVIATPLLLLMLLAIVQFALWSHATHIAQAAASQGLAAARVQTGTAADGSAEAQQVLDQLGRGPLTNTHIAATRGADAASIRVTGEASALIPLLALPVHAEAAGPVERFVPNVDGFANSEAVSGGNPSAGGTG